MQKYIQLLVKFNIDISIWLGGETYMYAATPFINPALLEVHALCDWFWEHLPKRGIPNLQFFPT